MPNGLRTLAGKPVVLCNEAKIQQFYEPHNKRFMGMMLNKFPNYQSNFRWWTMPS